jgi:DNA-binding HxlR family transcriptional regulator
MPRKANVSGEYAKAIPYEVRVAIDGLSNEARQAIVIALSENERLRFSELKKILSLSKPNLAFHLNKLMQSGLVSHRYDKLPLDERHGYYSLSDLGEQLLQGIQNSFTRHPVRQLDVKRLITAGLDEIGAAQFLRIPRSNRPQPDSRPPLAISSRIAQTSTSRLNANFVKIPLTMRSE